MDTRNGRVRLYAFSAMLWLLTIFSTYRAVESLGSRVWLFALFAAMMGTFTALRVRMGRADVSSAGLVAHLAVPALGPALASVLETFCVVGVLVEPKARSRWGMGALYLLVPVPVFTVMVLISGHLYVALGGPVGGHPVGVGRWLAAYIVMEAGFHVCNVSLMALQRAFAEWRSPIGFAVDLFRRLWVSQVVFIVVGVVVQSLYFELGPASLFVALALLLLVRANLRVQAENQSVPAEMAKTLARALSLRDPYTGGHSQRVADLAVSAGRVMGMTDTQIERLRDSALLHDIGKVAVPDAVLRKPGPLDAEEWRSMDVHVGAGGDLLEQSPHLKHLAGYVRSHHGGTGHTEEQPAEAPPPIPLEAQLIAVADAFDAMTSDRPYRRALPMQEAVRRLRAGAGTQFDDHAVEALLHALGLTPAVPAAGPAPSGSGDPPLAGVTGTESARGPGGGPSPQPSVP